MSFPVNLLYPAKADELSPGTLLYAGDSWWLRAELINRDRNVIPKVMALTGGRLGQMTMFSDANVLALNEEYTWQIRVSDPFATDTESSHIGAVTIGEKGNIGLWGHIYGAPYDQYCVSPSGSEVPSGTVPDFGAPKYTTYEVWVLDRKTRNPIGDRPLFTQTQTKAVE
ncbi:hypothetical protein JY438_06855 [Stenotrophomonas maltophilia]|nr:hypothetical protein [Stenotrophomonas maltophilia]